jgi:hypothetical protein
MRRNGGACPLVRSKCRRKKQRRSVRPGETAMARPFRVDEKVDDRCQHGRGGHRAPPGTLVVSSAARRLVSRIGARGLARSVRPTKNDHYCSGKKCNPGGRRVKPSTSRRPLSQRRRGSWVPLSSRPGLGLVQYRHVSKRGHRQSTRPPQDRAARGQDNRRTLERLRKPTPRPPRDLPSVVTRPVSETGRGQSTGRSGSHDTK